MIECPKFFFPHPEKLSPREQCAVVGVHSKSKNIARLTIEGLIELNHRGQESSGIAISNGEDFDLVKDSGLAGVVFGIKHHLPELSGAHIAIGHDRYSTSGSLAETQPFIEDGIALAHNGNLTNVRYLREKYGLPQEIDGAKSDSRMALAVINKNPGDEKEKIINGLREFEGAYSFVFATKKALFASRDPLGFKPLSLGQLREGDGFVVASEPVAFDAMGADFVRDVLPGETLMIDDKGPMTIALDQRSQLARCIFEPDYFARIDSTVFDIKVMDFRVRAGNNLSHHLPDVDLVMPVPRSGIGAALGVAISEIARSRQIPYMEGLYTNPYRGVVDGPRTYMLPNGRDRAATLKYSGNSSVLEGQRVAIVDDSILRGSLRFVVRKLREAGAREVHALISSPPIKHGCHMGADHKTGELIANKIPDLEERRKYFNLDSLYHLNHGEFIECALGNPVKFADEGIYERHGFCGACFTGRYPVSVEGAIDKTEVEVYSKRW